MNKVFYTSNEVAALLRVHKATLRTMEKEGTLVPLRIGRKRKRYLLEDVLTAAGLKGEELRAVKERVAAAA